MCINRDYLEQDYISMKFLTLQDQYVTLIEFLICKILSTWDRELRVNITILTGEESNTLALDQVNLLSLHMTIPYSKIFGG